MPTQAAYKARPYAGDADLKAICDLINLCNQVDNLEDEPYATEEDLRLWLHSPEMDRERNVRLWEDEHGQLVGLVVLQVHPPRTQGGQGQAGAGVVDVRMYLRTHPQARHGDLDGQMIEWAIDRAKQGSSEYGLPARLGTELHLDSPRYVAYRQPLLERYGFRPVRYFFKMARDLSEPLPEPQFPQGFTLTHSRGAEDAARWVEMFNESFVDHWNFHPATVEEHLHWLSSSKYDPARDLIAIAPDGTFAAFCFCWIDPDDNAHNNRNEGWIDILGTRRGFRRIGLGRAMLLAGMHKLKEDGAGVAVLGVDAENPSGALGLYESVGFRKVNTRAVYHLDL
jgi:mycothiol synthase